MVILEAGSDVEDDTDDGDETSLIDHVVCSQGWRGLAWARRSRRGSFGGA